MRTRPLQIASALLLVAACAESRPPASHPPVEVSVAATTAPSAASTADADRARELIAEADRAVEVNVDWATHQYEQARKLDPNNHRLLWKLSRAYEKKEAWQKMADVLAVAGQLAPEFATYHFKHGYALGKLGDEGDDEAWEAAKPPLRRCLRADPGFAECHYFLAEAHLQTLDDQEALEHFTRAIEIDPKVAYFYPTLAELYLVHKRYAEANQVLKEGTRIVPPTEETREPLVAMFLLQVETAQHDGDSGAMVLAGENAKRVAGGSHPEIDFILASAYALLHPPKNEKATSLLRWFLKRACRGAQAERYRHECEAAQSLIQSLGMSPPGP